MADIGASNWNETDASNSTAAPDGAPEGMAPSGVNDTMRAMMGATKRWYDWSAPLVTGGTSTAYTLTYAVAPVLADGMSHIVQFNAVNGVAPTLNVNALGAKPLHFYSGTSWGAFPANMVAVDQVVRVVYNAVAGTYRAIDLPMTLIQSVSGVTTVDFTAIPTNINHLQCYFDLKPSNNAVQFFLQVYGTGGSLDTGANYYYTINSGQSGAQSNTFSSGATSIPLNVNLVDNTNTGFSGTLSLSGIQATNNTNVLFQNTYLSGGAANIVNGAGAHVVTANITGIRFLISGGTFAGKITLTGTA